MNIPSKKLIYIVIYMIFYLVKDSMKQVSFHVFWKPVRANIADYFMNHHMALHHRVMFPIYIRPYNTQ